MKSAQVIGNMANRNLKTLPVCPSQFAILEIEGKKNEQLLEKGAHKARLSVFGKGPRLENSLCGHRITAFQDEKWMTPTWTRGTKLLVKGVKRVEWPQVIVRVGNIKFKTLPVYP